MTNAIIRKLHRCAPLNADDAEALRNVSGDVRTYSPHSDIVKIGAKPAFSFVILAGWAVRYEVVRDGTRQITEFLLPGDFCHLHMLAPTPMDHSIVALSGVTAAHVRHDEIMHLFGTHPNVGRAVQSSQYADESRLRALITTLGRRAAEHRVGYALCDLWARAEAIGIINNDCLDFPPTQTDLADYVGLTSVHVNRMMRRLREDGLLNLTDRCLALPDFNRLARSSGYEATATGSDRSYLASTPNRRSALAQTGLSLA